MKRTVTINGTVYDAHTGLPIDPNETKETKKAPVEHRLQPSHSLHHTTQRSQTLTRRLVQKTPAEPQPVAGTPVQKSPMVTKFAPHPVGIKSAKTFSDIGPVAHPTAVKAAARMNPTPKTAAPTGPKPSHVIKQEAIQEALDKAPQHQRVEKGPKSPRKFRKFISVGSVSLALLLLAGYFTYLNMPNLSVRVAAAQAGVDASYPEYRPDGYSLSGSIAYNQGWVSMKFASNGGPKNFTIKQSKSSWDSSAVLDNYVKEKAGDNYIPYNERGLTIYVFNSNAAWVNDGVLYTIEGDAPLSSDQIRHIATSM